MLLHRVAIKYKESNIYISIRSLCTNIQERDQRLEAFARTQFSRKRGILWASQRSGIERLCEESSFALCTPTGSGKTLVANLALIKELILRQNGVAAALALYLVPSRALAGEVERKLTVELGQDLVVTGLYGGTDWGVTDYWLNAEVPTVVIATVEKADALMRYLGPLLHRRLRLLVIDEAHQVVSEDDYQTRIAFAEHSNRSIRLESLVSRLLTQAPDVARIALTAVAGGASSPVARWIEHSLDAQAVGTRYRSTRQIVGTFETAYGSPGRMQLDLMNGRALFVQGRDEPVYLQLTTPPMPALSATMRSSIYRVNELNVLWHALKLIDDDLRILISIAQQPEKTMGWFKQALELDSWQNSLTFEIPEDEDERMRFEEAKAACIDYCGDDSYELALLSHGIATNHGQMPQRLRRLMNDLVERGICPITLATATLTEGVNLPFDIIFLTALQRRYYRAENSPLEEVPISVAEFRNLSGRAGRPGASSGMEGITLVALPIRPASTAHNQRQVQERQIRDCRNRYNSLRERLLAEEQEHAEVISPLALLLQGIAERARDLLGVEGESLLDWLDSASPADISDEAGRADTSQESRLADSVDELDGILLSAIEEHERLQPGVSVMSTIEETLIELWSTTFAAYAAIQEDWLEHAFVRRGCGLVNTVYPDAEERSRLYQYGYTPYVGRRFELVAPDIRLVMEGAQGYGRATPEQRLNFFIELGELIASDRGFGFRVRATETDRELLRNWRLVMGWWVLVPGITGPLPGQLRAWQRFVADNIEFRLGLAIGAVVARAWSVGIGDPKTVPSLDSWRETTGLPWFGFWARELLRWGTLDPFVAFALSQGLVQSREAAAARREVFENWLDAQGYDLEPEAYIDPRYFLAWKRSLHEGELAAVHANSLPAILTGTTGVRGSYDVVPMIIDNTINWIDAAGYVLAQSRREEFLQGRFESQDFQLRADSGQSVVERVFPGSVAPESSAAG